VKKVLQGAQKSVRLNPAVQKLRRFFRKPFSYDLPFILNHFNSNGTLNEQVYWLEQLISWVSFSGVLPVEEESGAKSSIQIVRLKFLLHVLNRNPLWKSNLAKTLRLIVTEGSCLELFSQTGLHQEFGFWAEAADRVIKKVLPTPPNPHDISELFGRVFADSGADLWFQELSAELFLELTELFYFEAEDTKLVFKRVRHDIQGAIAVLAATVAGVGLSRDLIRNRTVAPQESPFYRLSSQLNEVIEKSRQGISDQEFLSYVNSCFHQLHLCREAIKEIFKTLEETGVSIAVVYRLDQLQFALDRIEILIHLMFIERDHASMKILIGFLSGLIREQDENRGLMSLFRNNLRLLSRKVVERAGVTGEHYITTTKSEYQTMLKSGFGAGALTVFTTMLKSWVSSLKLPYFWEFMGVGTNYAGSFVAIQLFGFTLATKQPSSTAAHLASKLENINSQEKVDDFVDTFKKISRSQFAAAVGNVGMAAPASAIMFAIYYIFFGKPIMSTEYALYTMKSLDPFESLSIIYGAFTGILLWASSIVGGWTENWIVYRKIPDAIAFNRSLRARLGAPRVEKMAHWLSHNAAGLGSNTSLGFLMAGAPVVSRIFGLGLDVRHVTLSTCALTFAACSLWNDPQFWSLVGMGALGIFFIGLLNFGVSFYLALTIAARARSLGQGTVFFLLRQVLKSFVRSPKGFYYP